MNTPRNKVPLFCRGCDRMIEAGDKVMPGSYPTEHYHVECRRLAVLLSYPGMPRSAPDSDFSVGRLLKSCSCGSKVVEMKIEEDSTRGAYFRFKCCFCGITSIKGRYRATAAAAWNARKFSSGSLAVIAQIMANAEQARAVSRGLDGESIEQGEI